MNVSIAETTLEAGHQAARKGATFIRDAISRRGKARIIVATGASQLDLYGKLVEETIPWEQVTVFHLDEYIGIGPDHPASFRGYLRQRFEACLPTRTEAFHYLNVEGDPEEECQRVGELLEAAPIDLAFVGIGENGHLAFNDPPADFEAPSAYHVVELDKACRKQQLFEGWFTTMEEIPTQAISMTIPAIMNSATIVCTVPGIRKAQAVRDCLEGDVGPEHPASILQRHSACHVFLDADSASLLRRAPTHG